MCEEALLMRKTVRVVAYRSKNGKTVRRRKKLMAGCRVRVDPVAEVGTCWVGDRLLVVLVGGWAVLLPPGSYLAVSPAPTSLYDRLLVPEHWN
jgi:hypothetical protein